MFTKQYNLEVLKISKKLPVKFEINSEFFQIKFMGPLGISILPYNSFFPLYYKNEYDFFSSSLSNIPKDNFKLNLKETKNFYILFVKCDKKVLTLLKTTLKNMLLGVLIGFKKKIELKGVGYKVSMGKGSLIFKLHHSHLINYTIPININISIISKNVIEVLGIDPSQVSQVAADIRNFQVPEPYKGKGVFVDDEVIQLKEGKRQ